VTGGKGNGRDPAVRRLRIIAATVFLLLTAFIVLDGQPDNVATLGTLVGAMLVTLGFEVGLRMPGVEEKRTPKGEDDD
jgi:hypothetical protein